MDQLESDLRRALHDPRHALPSDDPLPGLLSRVRRRRRRRAVATVGGSSLAVVGLVALGSALLGGPSGTPDSVTASPTVRPSTGPVPTPGRPSPSAAGVPPVRAATDTGPVPAGFTGTDLSFVSADRGWALGTAPCAAEPCTSLLRTFDGGVTWSGGPAPLARLAPPGTSCGLGPCVSQLRFADSRHGYAFGNGVLVTTVDGGAHWKTVPGARTISLEAAGTDLIRVVTTSDGCPPGCTFTVQRSSSFDGAWTTVQTPPLSGIRTLLLRHADDAYVLAFGNPAGGAGSAHAQVLASSDRGRTWTARPDPCSPDLPNAPTESDAHSAAVAPDGSLVVLCQARMAGGPVTVTVSHDRGASFTAARSLPAGSTAGAVAASGNRLLAEVLVSGRRELLRSADGGASWAVAATATARRQDSGLDGFLAFTSADTGRWVPPGSASVWTTRDAGQTWSRTPFRR